MEEATNLVLIVNPLNQRGWVTSILLSGQLDKPQTSKALELGGETCEQLLSCVCSHQTIPRHGVRAQHAVPGRCRFPVWIKHCPPAAALPPPWAQPFPGTAQSLPNLFCAVVAALSRAVFAASKRRKQCVIDVSDIQVSGQV